MIPDPVEADVPALPIGRSRWRRRVAVGAIAAVATPAAWFAATTPLPGLGDQSGAPPGVGQAAPAFTLKAADGGTVNLAALRGKPVLINFWATWCTPCRDELPELEHAYRNHRADGLVVVAVSLDTEDAARDIPEFLALGNPSTGSFTFPVALDTNQATMRLYRLVGVPSSYFVDRAGIVRAVQPGVMNREVLTKNLKSILRPA